MIKLKEVEYREKIGKEKDLKKQRQIFNQRAALVNELTKLIGKTITDVKIKEFISFVAEYSFLQERSE